MSISDHPETAPTHHIADALGRAKACVVKLGSQVIVDEHDGRLSLDRVASFVKQLADLYHAGKKMILVSSGAVALGRPRAGFTPQQRLTQEQKQACAAVGQSLMMTMYRDFFRHLDIEVAQVLVNPSDFSDRVRYMRLKGLLTTLLDMGILPIINENDAIPDSVGGHFAHSAHSTGHPVTPSESRLNSFNDNDKLAALVAAQVEADILLVLSNVNGVYTANPFDDPTATLLRYIPQLSALKSVDTTGTSTFGRGGMASKLEATEIASISGCSVIISNGFLPQSIAHILDYRGTDDAFPASFIGSHRSADTSFKRWIGHASGYSGIIIINEGAQKALCQHNASLLAVGVEDVVGEFFEGDVVLVQVHNETDHMPVQNIARGVVQYNSKELRRVKGLHSQDILQQLGRSMAELEVIHRDKLVILN